MPRVVDGVVEKEGGEDVVFCMERKRVNFE